MMMSYYDDDGHGLHDDDDVRCMLTVMAHDGDICWGCMVSDDVDDG